MGTNSKIYGTSVYSLKKQIYYYLLLFILVICLYFVFGLFQFYWTEQ